MDREMMKKKILREAREAFKLACTLREDHRVEVYLEKENVRRSGVMGPKDEILYQGERVMLYQVFGNDYLEEEIRTWIDQARSEEAPQGLAKNIQDAVATISKQTGKKANAISSNEVFANLSLNIIEQIETAILEYWWENGEEENGKILALGQIEAALANLP